MSFGKKISIIVITYNHEKYIAKALDSILMQQTSYEYEVIIGEDCSTDNTRTIIAGYQQKFGHRLHLLHRDKNLGMLKNTLDCLKHCNGEYIAFLEGDDYWLDSHKLQKQIDYMEKHKECILTSHSWVVVNQKGETISEDHIVQEHICYGWKQYASYELPGQASTWIVRNKLEQMITECMPLVKKYFWIVPDRSITFIMLLYGEIHILPDLMSAYRYAIEEGAESWSAKHDIESKHNYVSLFVQMIGIEHMARKKNIVLDFYEARKWVFRRSRKYYRQSHNIGVWLQGVLLILLEPKKKRLLKELFS